MLYFFKFNTINYFYLCNKKIENSCTHRIQGCINIAIWTIRQSCFLQIDFHVIGSRCCGTTPLWFGCIQQHFEGGNGMQLGRLFVHLAWNIIFVIFMVVFWEQGCLILDFFFEFLVSVFWEAFNVFLHFAFFFFWV